MQKALNTFKSSQRFLLSTFEVSIQITVTQYTPTPQTSQVEKLLST